MFNLVICDKNREKFFKWFRKNVELRNLFLAGYSDFLHNHGCCCGFIYEVPSLAVMAEKIFDDMIHWNIDQLHVYPDTAEVCFTFCPYCFVRDGGIPTWIKNGVIMRKYLNDVL